MPLFVLLVVDVKEVAAEEEEEEERERETNGLERGETKRGCYNFESSASASGGGANDGVSWGKAEEAGAPERLCDDDVHGDAERLRVLRGDTRPDQIAC